MNARLQQQRDAGGADARRQRHERQLVVEQRQRARRCAFLLGNVVQTRQTGAVTFEKMADLRGEGNSFFGAKKDTMFHTMEQNTQLSAVENKFLWDPGEHFWV